MLRNYLITAFRNAKRNTLVSFITVAGMAIGMAACLLILQYVQFETSYDRFHKDSDRIYRLRYERTSEEGQSVRFASCCPPALDVIRGAFPEVEEIARIYRWRAVMARKDEDVHFTEERMYFAEPEFFNIFDYTFLEGDSRSGIREANSAFISHSTAVKYFGGEDPMGRVLTLDGRVDYAVAGIFEDIPPRSHLKFDILLSYPNLVSMLSLEVLQSWGYTGFFTYLRLRPDADPAAFEQKLPELVRTHAGELMDYYKVRIELKMQPLRDIHLTSHFMQEYEINGSRTAVDILLIVAFFIIIMAWVNHINLSTSRALTRAREVGLRKIVGASRGQLAVQFFVETFVMSALALILAVGLMNLCFPYFTRISGIPVDYAYWKTSAFWLALPILFLAGIVLSGSYPVALMSAYRPVVILRGKLGIKPQRMGLRKALVVFQFVTALVLITATFTVSRQMNYMKKQDQGFDMQQMIVVNLPRIRGETFGESVLSFKEELLRQSAVEKICVVTEVPGRQIVWDNGGIHRAGEDKGKGKNYQIVGIDYDFVGVFNLKIVQGRNFSRDFPTDKDALLLNETAVKWMGFQSNEEAIGESVNYWGEIYPIIGVLADYHQQSLKQAFEPHLFRLYPYGRPPWGRFAIKVNPRNIDGTLRLVERYFERFFPGNPFEYFFLDDYFNQQYMTDDRFGRVLGIFSFLALFVTCLGIFGMSTFMAVQRTREIGIRKVLGASTSRILGLLAREFMVLMGISLLVAWPLAFWGARQWLDAFAFRMPWNFFLLLVPLIIVFVITALTVGSNVLKAASSNPVESIKHE